VRAIIGPVPQAESEAMKTRSRVLVCACAVLLGALLRPWAGAAGPASAMLVDQPLLPTTQLGFLRLEACIVEAELLCERVCTLRIKQTYHLENIDSVKPTTLGFRLLPWTEGGTPPEITLRDDKTGALRPSGRDTGAGTSWQLTLAPEERRVLTLSYVRAIESQHFFQWQWDLAALKAWGAVGSARVTLRLPADMSLEALLHVAPAAHEVAGRELSWNWERVPETGVHVVQALLPAVYNRVEQLRQAEDHLALARLLVELQKAATEEGAPVSNLYEQIIYHYSEAIARAPGEVAPRLELAEAYRRQGARVPGLRLNYLILAAQELEGALALAPGNLELAAQLRATYRQIAEVARAAGDLAGALVYHRKAQPPGAASAPSKLPEDDLLLEWAVDLAQRGRVDQVLQELGEQLSPRMEDALLRYAPAFVSARTRVRLTPHERIVSYHLRLYRATAQRVRSELESLLATIGDSTGCHTSLRSGAASDTTIEVEVRQPYGGLPDLATSSARVVKELGTRDEELAALLAIPFQTEMSAFSVEQTHWFDALLYRERLTFADLQSVWERRSQYVAWRLVELATTPSEDARAEWEARLVSLALRDQRHLWEQLPSACYWVYEVDIPGGEALNERWLVNWGQEMTLSANRTVYDWAAIAEGALVAMAVGLAAVGASLLKRKG